MATSFADLKRNRKTTAANLEKQIEDQGQSGASDNTWWKLKTDEKGNGLAIIRFLPASEGEDSPFIKYISHYFAGPTREVYNEKSLRTFDEKDPVNEYNKLLYNSGRDKDKLQASAQKQRKNFVFNVYVVEDKAQPEKVGQVFKFRSGPQIFEMIEDQLKGVMGSKVNVFDLWDGANFVFRAVGEKVNIGGDMKIMPKYDRSQFVTPAPLFDEDDDALFEKVWKSQHKLADLIDRKSFKSYADLHKRLEAVRGHSVEISGTNANSYANDPKPKTERSAPKEEVKATPQRTEAEDTSGDEEDEFSPEYFAKMLAK